MYRKLQNNFLVLRTDNYYSIIIIREYNCECIDMATTADLKKFGFNAEEIAEQTSFSIMHVKSHIQNGKRNLKIIMEKMSIGQ